MSGDIRTWTVRSNSFRPDYGIGGRDVGDAIRRNIGAITRDALPSAGGWVPISAAAEWRPDILRGQGGVELLITARRDGSSALYPVWIAAGPSEIEDGFFLSMRP